MTFETRAKIGTCLYDSLLFEEAEAIYPDYLSMLTAYQWCVNNDTILPVEYYEKVCQIRRNVSNLQTRIASDQQKAQMLLMADHPVLTSICSVEVGQWIIQYTRDAISGDNEVEQIISNKHYLDWNSRHALFDFVRASYFLYYVRGVSMTLERIQANLEMLCFKNRSNPYVMNHTSALHPRIYDRKIFKDNHKDIESLAITSVQARESFHIGSMKEFYEYMNAYGYEFVVFTDENGNKHQVRISQ